MPPKCWLGDVSSWLSNMEGLDALPIASQGKSVLLALSGDHEGAAKTQENFTRRCVGISQVRQVVERHRGDEEGAARTQAEFSSALRQADQVVGSFLVTGAAVAEQVSQTIQESGLPGHLRSGVETILQRGMSASDRIAQQLSESSMGRHFSELVERTGQPWGGAVGSSSMSAAASGSVANDGLDRYTLLTKAAASQCSGQCPCCMENFKEGEMLASSRASILFTRSVRTRGWSRTLCARSAGVTSGRPWRDIASSASCL
eukprot:CAMPEP_0183448940 /NCGR_PEP_ID=MMETSP0370-20130417/108059_1 /TAXON_ID=268820 /ORGANISM="Peridinium aciculiferum, Strain PAER-2" /LENGTH=259 /DNA_ID=CAMNT_0025639969 /DNA_START=29 /DNA_END=805 /DNA_ORIENTATION=-